MRGAKMPHAGYEPHVKKGISETDLMQLLESDDARVLVVGLWDMLGFSKQSPEIVTFNGVSEQALQFETNPISIVGEGWRFSTPGYEKERRADATTCYRRFVEVCKALKPSYGAILNEDSLTCPFDLKQGNGTRCFSNFFISEQAFGTSMLAKIESMYHDAYTERFQEGLYVSTWMFSPRNIITEQASAVERSKRVATMIASLIP